MKPGVRFSRILVFFLFLLRFSVALPAEPFLMLSPGDSALEDFRQVMREGGQSVLSFTPPLSGDEVKAALAGLDPETLSPSGQEAWRRLEAWLDPPMRFRESFFSLSFHIVAELEAGFRTNTAIPRRGADAMRPALLSFPLNLHFADFVQLAIEPALNLDPWFNETEGHFIHNIPLEARRIDMYFPFRAFAALGGKWWNFQIGRDRLDFGTGRTGNLLISDTPDYYDFLRLSFFSKHFKYSVLVSQMPMLKASYDENSPYLSGLADLKFDPERSTQRYFYLHRLDVKIFDTISLGLAEGLMAGNSAPELRYLNPITILHNFMSGFDYNDWISYKDSGGNRSELDSPLNNSILSFDFNWTPLRNFSVYGQFVLDEFTTPWEAESDESMGQTPNSFGALAGLEWGFSAGPWGALLFGEAVYTTPYLYTDNSPFAATMWMRRNNRESPGNGYRYRWTGHSEGRDMMMFALGANFSRGADLALGAELSLIVHGEHGLRWDWGRGPFFSGQSTPTGTAEKKLTAALSAAWKPFPFLTLRGELAGILALGANNTAADEFGLEALFSVRYVF